MTKTMILTGARTICLAFCTVVSLAQAPAKGGQDVWWSPDLKLSSLSEVPEALSSPVTVGGKTVQVTLVNGSTKRAVQTCTEYLDAVAQKLAPMDDKGDDTPFVERCYPLNYLRGARSATKSFVQPRWGDDALQRLPPFDIFVEASLAAKADRARRRGESWQRFDPKMRVVSISDRNLILENATVRWSLELLAVADVNHDGLNDAIVIACDSMKTTGGGLCFPMVLTVSAPNTVYRLLSSSSPPYALKR
jgi:hypothetical protein